MIRFRHAFLTILAVLIVHVFAVGFGWYGSVEWFDVPMHFFGGYAMAILALALWNWIGERVEIRSRLSDGPVAQLLLEGIFVIGFVMIVGVAWEWYEFLFDQFATAIVQKFGAAQPSLADTMDDLFNDCIGAVTAWVFWRHRS